jgi:hypothetical protein
MPEDVTPSTEREAQLGRLPGYSKLVSDQILVLGDLVPIERGPEPGPETPPEPEKGFASIEDLVIWKHEIVAHGLGRHQEEFDALTGEIALPWLLADMKGETAEGMEYRARLADWLSRTVFAGALRQMAVKAQEEMRVETKIQQSGRIGGRLPKPLPPPPATEE